MIGNYIKGDRVHYRNQFGQEFYATVVHVGRGNVLLVLRDDMERCETVKTDEYVSFIKVAWDNRV